MGTRFLITRESPVPDVTLQRYLEAGCDDVILSSALDGLPQRMIRNELTSGSRRPARCASSRWPFATPLPCGARPARRFRRSCGARSRCAATSG